MPYEPHPDFKQPDDENAAIWRYLDFTKFVSLLDRRELFFSTVDGLSKSDPFEGSLPFPNVVSRSLIMRKVAEYPKVEYSEVKEQATLTREGFGKRLRSCVGVNCWHINQYESVAMWKLYLKSDEGIAITSISPK